MRLLIIEDNESVVAALRRGLLGSYVVDVSMTGNGGHDMAELNDYDLIMIDLSLPDADGADICRDLRRTGNKTPILILTGRVNVDDKVKLLDYGADDYLTKPFSLEELKARIRALLRRETTQVSSSTIIVGDLSMDTTKRLVSRGGSPIRLRRKEYDLLEYLMREAEKPLSRQMILDHVWDMNENLWTNAIDVHIKYLRDKIDRPFGGSMIKTVHGVGYKIVPELAVTATERKGVMA